MIGDAKKHSLPTFTDEHKMVPDATGD